MTNNHISSRILITDGYWRKSLAALWALADSGFDVGVGERTPLATALFSRYAKWRFIYPSISKNPNDFILWLSNVVKKFNFNVLLCPEESTSLFIAKNRHKLDNSIKIPIPEYDKILFARDKYKMMSFVKSLNLPHPKTNLVSKLEDIDIGLKDHIFPLVIKPVIGSGSRGVLYINSKESLYSAAMMTINKFSSFLLQEYIPGEEFYGVSVIFNSKNQMRSAFVHKKIRQYPISGGVSTYAVSVHNQALVDLSEKILSQLGWYGIANLEFKLDARDKIPKLMEVNPRLWGALHLATKAGINFPKLMCELAETDDIKPQFDYQDNIKYRWLLPGDILSFFSEISCKKKINFNFFNFFEKNMHYAILSPRDPLPTLGRLLSIFDYLTSKEMRQFRA